jgi:post-segregation antitoxin (ccd killing protein)
MPRERVSTTVDGDLLAEARARQAGVNDATLFDAALAALVRASRAAEIDSAYTAAYDDHPLDEADEWGDLASFRDAAAAS